ncbi:hypothetical protein RB195_002292 [Necator americanus]|uniref:H/ACA ribonucleoprotein complex subunit n=1 Tax=Necator americanus TaxID=51031 RepID=A0ABR1DIL4_NECAM
MQVQLPIAGKEIEKRQHASRQIDVTLKPKNRTLIRVHYCGWSCNSCADYDMSFRGGRGGGGGRGFRGSGRGGFRGGRGGGGDRGYDQGPPEEVIEVGEFTHTCEDDIVCKTTCGKIPFFNAPLYFKGKEKVGKIDEIFGSLLDNGFSVTLSDGVKAASFKVGQKLYIDPAKLMPIERFLPGAPRGGRGRGGRGRGGDRYRGGDRGGVIVA